MSGDQTSPGRPRYPEAVADADAPERAAAGDPAPTLRLPDLPDAALAAGVGGLVLLGTWLAPPSRAEPDLLAYLLALVGALALVGRRRAPVAVVVVAWACALAYGALGYPGVYAAMPVLIAIYTAVRHGRLRVTAVVTAAGVALGAAAMLLTPVEERPVREVAERMFLVTGWLVAAGVAGEVSRHRLADLRQVERRAADAERTREETARRRAGEERLRIARELHDSLTHSISVIKVQAGVAVHLFRKRGEEVPEALLAIQETSGEAMRELRGTLEALRAPGTTGSGLDRVPELVERARSAGLEATVTITGERRKLPGEIDRAAYRIVQEALTNVTRHAGPATASVRIGYAPDCLTVQVEDDGHATLAQPPVAGAGLVGMRERVTAFGGSLRAEPKPEGGFTVHAELPVGDAP